MQALVHKLQALEEDTDGKGLEYDRVAVFGTGIMADPMRGRCPMDRFHGTQLSDVGESAKMIFQTDHLAYTSVFELRSGILFGLGVIAACKELVWSELNFCYNPSAGSY